MDLLFNIFAWCFIAGMVLLFLVCLIPAIIATGGAAIGPAIGIVIMVIGFIKKVS